jgi:hypothetical protein
MPPCASCRRTFADNEDNTKLADHLEDKHPGCECEQFSVGEGSPGTVQDSEFLHRIIVSPRDYDPETGKILQAPFEKVFRNGLSVCRDCATVGDLSRLTQEGLAHPKDHSFKQVYAVLQVSVADVRSCLDTSNQRIFCVYDQTVTAKDGGQPVPTHAGIFQRMPPRGTPNGNRLRKDNAGVLRSKFTQVNIKTFGQGVMVDLNDRAKRGDFSFD